MDVFVMAFFAGHVEIDDLVLVSIVNIVCRLDVQLSALFVFNYCAQSLRDCVQEGGFAYSRVSNDCDLEAEVVVIDLTTSSSASIGVLLLL